MKRKYTLKEDFFNNIDNAAKAYWLGFIQADGAIDGPRENQLRIKIQKSDRKHLELFAEHVNYNGPIREKDNHVKINITSKELTEGLKQWGIVRNKTYSVSILDLDKSLMSSYILGLFDGDGCACYYIDKKKRHVLCFSIVLNNHSAQQLKSFMLDELNINLRISDRKTYSELQTTKIDNLRLLYDYFYKNQYYLERKKSKFDSYFKHKRDAQRL